LTTFILYYGALRNSERIFLYIIIMFIPLYIPWILKALSAGAKYPEYEADHISIQF
jgi:hypothetical protein